MPTVAGWSGIAVATSGGMFGGGGGVAATVAALVSVSGLLASSVKLTFTLIVLPRSAPTSV